MGVRCKPGTNRWRKCSCYAQRGMSKKKPLIEVQFASIDRGRRGRCRRAEESQLCHSTRLPLERAACRHLTRAPSLAVYHDPWAMGSAFAIATRPFLLLMSPVCGSAALHIEAPLMSDNATWYKEVTSHHRPRELPRVRLAGTMLMHPTF